MAARKPETVIPGSYLNRTPRAQALLGGLAIALAGGLCALGLDGAGAGPIDVPCGNFGRVDVALYRGAEPDEACLRYLSDLGVGTVVSLRDEADASEREEANARALGMEFINQPMSGFGRPGAAAVRRVLEVIRASGDRPVFVHCRRGRDRTGVIVAAYRIAHDGWDAPRALREARRFGLAWWQVRMKGFVRDFAAETAEE